MPAFDVAIVRALNGAANASPFWGAIGVFLAKYLVFFVVAVPIVGAVTPQGRRLIGGWIVMMRTMLVIGVSVAGNFLLGLAFFRARPYVTLDGVERLYRAPLFLKSYPSDHTTVAFAVAWCAFLVRPKTGYVLFPLAALVGVGRVMAGVHYPTDVLAGALIALPWSWLVERAMPVESEEISAADDDEDDRFEAF